MAMFVYANNARTTLGSVMTATQTQLIVATGTGGAMPVISATGDYYSLTLTQPGAETSWEIVKVRSRASDVLTVIRAQEGTSGFAWPVGSKVENRLTVAGLNTFEVNTPRMTAPAHLATNVTRTPGPIFSTDAFVSSYGATHTHCQLQISTVDTFATTVYSSGDSTAFTTNTVNYAVSFNGPGTAGLAAATTYFARIRFKTSRGIYSDWSIFNQFTTATSG